MSSRITVSKEGQEIQLEVPEVHDDIVSLKEWADSSKEKMDAIGTKLEALEKSVNELAEAIGKPAPIEPPIDKPVSYLEPGAKYWESTEEGEVLYLNPGKYKAQIYVKHNYVKIIGINDDTGNKPVVDGRVSSSDLGLTWTPHEGDLWSAVIPELPGIWHFEDGHPTGKARNHDAVHPLLCTVGDGMSGMLKYNPIGTLDINPGEFSLNAPAGNAGIIYVKLTPAQSIMDFKLSDKPWLLEGGNDIEGLEIRNINFEYCSNTGKIGMVNTPGKNGVAEDVGAYYSNTIGFKLGSRESIHSKANLSLPAVGWNYKNIDASFNGQCGIWGEIKGTPSSWSVVEGYQNNNNGWKGGHAWWEVSSKFIRCSYVKFLDGVCNGNEGAGFWFDIWNTNVEVDGLYADNNKFCGVLLEHYLYDLNAKNITISNTRDMVEPDGQGGTWTVNAGLILQSNIENCVIENLYIENCSDGIRLNHADTRGDVKNNTIIGYSHKDVSYPVRHIGTGDGSNKIEFAF